MTYVVRYDKDGKPSVIEMNGRFIPISEDNVDFREFLAWNAKQIPPLDYQTPVTPDASEPPLIEFSKPVKAPDFIVSTPKINDDPELALDEAVAEMKKGEGSEKSIALIALSLAKYLEAKRSKLR